MTSKRTVLLIAAVAALGTAVSGCSGGGTTTNPVAAQAPAGAPAPGPDRPVAELAAWIAAAPPVADVNTYSTLTDQHGTVVPVHTVGDAGYVFDSPTGKIRCYLGTVDYLDCRVRYRNLAPRPAGGIGNWLPTATEYTGDSADVGEFRGGAAEVDMGTGNTLAYGSRFTFGNYSCRMDTSGLYCARTGSGSGIRMSDTGLVTYGCLQPHTQPDGEPISKC